MARPAARKAVVRPPRVRMDVDERRAQLMKLGKEFFSAQAYDAVSIDDVAQAAGISKGLLYHYFPTKRDFYVATVTESAQELLDTTRAEGPGTPMERLCAGLDAYLRYVADHGPAYAALLRSGVGSDPAVGRIVEETRSRFLKRLLSGVGVETPPPRLRSALRAWLGFVEAAALDWVDHRDVELLTLREMMTDALAASVRFAMGGAALSPF